MSNSNIKPTLCIAGQNQLAVQGLELVVQRYPDFPICFIATQSDTGVDGWQPSLIRKAQALDVKQVTLQEMEAQENLILFSLQFAEIIKTKKFKSNRLYNLHFSKLPQYKGMYPAVHPILRGEKTSGVTLHLIDDGIDTGDIIAQSTFNIELHDTARDLYFKQTQHAIKLFKKNLENLVEGQFTSYKQPPEGASYYAKASINFADFKMDFNKTAFEIHNQFRAFAFREYQMPIYREWSILKTQITYQKSTLKAGTLVEETDTYFLLAGVDFNVKLLKDYYPKLWDACQTGDFAQFQSALPFIDEINLRNSQGWCALVIAAYHGHLDIVKALIQHGAQINSTNYKGTTALMYALSHYEMHQNDSVFKYLISCGADTAMQDAHGKNVRDYIAEKGLQKLLNNVDA